MIQGPEAGLELLRGLVFDPRVNADRRLHAVRAHLLETTGNIAAAPDDYATAARQATNRQQQRYLHRQIARLDTQV
jgi:predicted RNA polymerase sigma factor